MYAFAALFFSTASHTEVVSAAYPSERVAANKQKAAAARVRSSTDSSPFVARVAGGPDRLDIEVQPYCQSGAATTDPLNWCSDAPPLLTELAVTFTPDNWPAQTVWFNSSQLACAAAASASGARTLLLPCYSLAHLI